MVGIRDFFDAFKPGLKAGPTEEGTWRQLEAYGRLTGTGEVEGDLELPEGEVLISNEENVEVEDFEIELTGPDGVAVPLELHRRQDTMARGAHNLWRMATAKVTAPGLHHLTVRGPAGSPLIVLVGREMGARDLFG